MIRTRNMVLFGLVALAGLGARLFWELQEALSGRK